MGGVSVGTRNDRVDFSVYVTGNKFALLVFPCARVALLARRLACCRQQVACCPQPQHVACISATMLLTATSNMLRATCCRPTCCAGVNAALGRTVTQ